MKDRMVFQREQYYPMEQNRFKRAHDTNIVGCTIATVFVKKTT